jgi:hypothetical protein
MSCKKNAGKHEGVIRFHENIKENFGGAQG